MLQLVSKIVQAQAVGLVGLCFVFCICCSTDCSQSTKLPVDAVRVKAGRTQDLSDAFLLQGKSDGIQNVAKQWQALPPPVLEEKAVEGVLTETKQLQYPAP